MSSNNTATNDEQDCAISDYGIDGVTVEESLSLIRDAFSMGNRPVSLSYQVEPLIAETLQDELQTDLLYDHVVNETRYRAWEFTDTGSEALVEMTVTDGDSERVHYARPPLGEAIMDFRWWLIRSHVRNKQTSIKELRNRTLETILSSSRNEWHPGLRVLLDEAM